MWGNYTLCRNHDISEESETEKILSDVEKNEFHWFWRFCKMEENKQVKKRWKKKHTEWGTTIQ